MFGILVAAALSVGTQGQLGVIDSELDMCLQAQPRTKDAVDYLTQCYLPAYARSDEAVREEQAQLLVELRRTRIPVAPAVAAQADWLKYRNHWCQIEGQGDVDPFARKLTQLQCRTEVTQQRLFRLKSAYQRQD